MSGSDALLPQWGRLGLDLPTVESAHDEYLVTADGERIIDACSGLVVANLGHSVPGVADVMRDQAEAVSFVAPTRFTTDPAIRLAERLTDATPPGLDTAFFVSSGSQAVESALKLARVYHRRTGNPEKTTFVSRWQSYHGSTLGALSLSGRSLQRHQFRSLLHGWPHLPAAYPYRWDYDGPPEEQAVAAARELETLVRQEGPETVAGFVAEPVGGSTLPAAAPHPAYFREIRRICDEYDLLFVADEVMTGFGRTGPTFAVERYDVVPDVLVVGKGLTGGYAPVSGLAVHDRVAEHFRDEGDRFAHGFTYGSNPVGCAVGAHVVEQYTEEVLRTGRERGRLLEETLEPLHGHPIVGDLRRTGLLLGIEFVADPETSEPFDPDLNVAERVHRAALESGAFVYPGQGCVDGVAGDHVTVAPPLTSSEEAIRKVGRILVSAVDEVAGDLGIDG